MGDASLRVHVCELHLAVYADESLRSTKDLIRTQLDFPKQLWILGRSVMFQTGDFRCGEAQSFLNTFSRLHFTSELSTKHVDFLNNFTIQ